MLTEKLHGELRPFVNRLLFQLNEKGLVPDIFEIDHACYRVATADAYLAYKEELQQIGELLSEAQINGRPIATYRLHQPLVVAHGFHVPLIELPFPKPGRPYEEGFEHIEAVVRKPLEVFMAKHRHQNFDTTNLSATINRDISLQLTGGLVKFHEASLEWIIAIEVSQNETLRMGDRRS